MLELLWLVPVAPLAGFTILAIIGARIPRRAVAVIAVGSVAVSTILSILIWIRFAALSPTINSYSQTLWTWMKVGKFQPSFALYLDSLSLIMILVVTFVSMLIHLYSIDFMKGDKGYSRFFAYMNLFVSSMLILVLADNLLFLYLGWEGVGLCSYLLIGFWYTDPANSRAAIKAFIVTRIGDTAMAIGIFLLFMKLGTLGIQPLMQKISEYPAGSAFCVTAAALILGGAIGKSAQLPLQTWLPDAMAGPTPVSALIHAATMVTAGVYLIARTHVLFTQAPAVQYIVAIIGAVTLLMAGFSALTQLDIKRILAYSTISQIGYMFLALGVGAWSAAIFHFMIHAFFKSLLFLAAGVIILALGKEHNIFKMGGLYRRMPFTFCVFLIGCASLSALPLITAGFYSKDMILIQVWTSKAGGMWLWAAGLAGALLTSVYSFRMLFITFFGDVKTVPNYYLSFNMKLPLAILGLLSIIGGFVELPELLGSKKIFTSFIQTALPPAVLVGISNQKEFVLQTIPSVISLAGIYLAYLFFLRSPELSSRIVNMKIGVTLHKLWFSDWGFDWFYNMLFVKPYVWFADFNREDYIDRIYAGIARVNEIANRILSLTQTGKVRWYVTGIAIGGVGLITIMVLL